METVLVVMLGALALGTWVRYGRVRNASRMGLIWLAGAIVGFLLAGPLGMIVGGILGAPYAFKRGRVWAVREKTCTGGDIVHIAASRNVENYDLNPDLYVAFHGDPHSQNADE